MAYVLTLQLSFEETIVLSLSLANYIEVASHGSETDEANALRARRMLATVEEALARGPTRRKS